MMIRNIKFLIWRSLFQKLDGRGHGGGPVSAVPAGERAYDGLHDDEGRSGDSVDHIQKVREYGGRAEGSKPYQGGSARDGQRHENVVPSVSGARSSDRSDVGQDQRSAG